MRIRRLFSIVAGGLLATGLVACGDGAEVTDPSSATVPHVGELPDLQTGRGPDGRPAAVGTTPAGPPAPDTVVGASAPTGATPADSAPGDITAPDGTATEATTPATDTVSEVSVPRVEAVVEGAAAGNRILALGDSITAAIGPEYGGQLCDALVPQGWFVGVDALQGRAIDAGLAVLREDIDVDDWDAAIVNLGSNYRGEPGAYETALRQILDRLRTVPVLVVTVTEFEEEIAEVNFVIRDVALDRDEVWVVEWSELTRDDDSLTGADGLHLSEDGRAALAAVLADAVGEAPTPPVVEPGCERRRDAEAGASGGTGDGGDDGGG